MTKKIDQFHKNNIWQLVPKDKIEPGYCPFGEKYVYKVKRDINGNITRFKASRVVKGYF